MTHDVSVAAGRGVSQQPEDGRGRQRGEEGVDLLLWLALVWGELGVVGKEGLGWSTGVSDRELWEARELTWVSMGRTNKSRNGVSTF